MKIAAKLFSIWILSFGLLFTAAGPRANATQAQWNVSTGLGLGSNTSGGASSYLQAMLAGSYFFTPIWEGGIQVVSGGSFTMFAAEGNYHTSDFYVGAQLGPFYYNGNSGIGFGPQTGYDHDLGGGWSVGIEIQFQVLVYTMGVNANGTTVSTNLTPMGVLTYGFN